MVVIKLSPNKVYNTCGYEERNITIANSKTIPTIVDSVLNNFIVVRILNVKKDVTNIILVVHGFSRPCMQRYSHAFTGVLVSVCMAVNCENLEQQIE
jgi:hypothetical protein